MPAIVLECDGCGVQLTVDTKFPTQARNVAKGEGWLIATSQGEPGSAAAIDYCPSCKPLFEQDL